MENVTAQLDAADYRNRQAEKKLTTQASCIDWLITQKKISMLAIDKHKKKTAQLQLIANRVIKLKGTVNLSKPDDTFDAGGGGGGRFRS
jgi:hypothetical protein